MEKLMNDFMFDFRQSHADRLEDAGIVKYGEHVNLMPKAPKGTMRSRILKQVRHVLLRDAR